MNEISLVSWLVVEKHMNERSAKDVLSRCERIKKMLKIEILNNESLELLLECEDFQTSSMFVKSQLKRAITLFLEFKRSQEGK